MRVPRTAAWALAVAVTVGAAARGQDDTYLPPPDPESATEQGFPWLCFVTSVATIGGLAVLVQRAKRKAQADGPGGGWFCRACGRDVAGPECPYCRAPNVFLHEPAAGRAAGGMANLRLTDD
jgi:hypothetical protein